jgi:hypothetical protein
VSNDIEASGGDLYYSSLDERSSEFPVRNKQDGCRYKDLISGI